MTSLICRGRLFISHLSFLVRRELLFAAFLGEKKKGGRKAFSHRTCVTFTQSSLALNRPLFKDVSQVPVDVLLLCKEVLHGTRLGQKFG